MSEQVVFTPDNLPGAALDAAALFHGQWVRPIRQSVADGAAVVAVVLPPAPVDHADWRCSAARDLARAIAPARINFLAGSDQAAIDGTLAYLSNAPGVTGHYLLVHGD